MTETSRCRQCGAELRPNAPKGLCPKCLLGAGIEETGERRMDNDRNLLFGVLAVQLRKVTQTQVMDIAAAWAMDPSRDLPGRLVEAGLLSKEDRELLGGFVQQAIDAHGGDSAAAMESFGGDEQVHQSFRGSIVREDSGRVSVVTTPMPVGEAMDPESVPAVRETPGRYTHITEHGRGGMGRVLLVQDTHLGRDVALKELLPAPGDDSQTGGASPVRLSVPHMARFLQEARLTGQLEHPAIVPVYELGHRKDGTLYYTMKLVRGKTLAKALKECKVLKDRLELLPHFRDLCQAMAYAHSRGVIHRDLKPSNVMVGEFGETVVIDWGLAKAKGRSDALAEDMEETLLALRLGDEAGLAQTVYGQAMGTPMYMPPEQAKGLIDQIDERSDVYSLGAVLYELLTGKTPFTGKTSIEIMKKVVAESPAPVATLEPDAPPELAAICQRAMAHDPAGRYASARELAVEIGRFQSGLLVQAFQYKPWDLLRHYVRRNKAVVTTAASAFAALLLIGTISFLRISWAKEAAEYELYRASVNLAEARIEEQELGQAREYLNSCPERLRGWEWGRLQYLCNQDLMTFKLEPYSAATCIDFSPDGQKLIAAIVKGDPYSRYYNSTGSQVKTWDAGTGEQLADKTLGAGEIRTFIFTPDGKCIGAGTAGRHYSKEGQTAVVWDLAAGTKMLEFGGHTDGIFGIALSPDGNLLATSAADNTVKVWEVTTGNMLLDLKSSDQSVLTVAFSPDGTLLATAGHDKLVRLWNPNTGELVKSLARHAESISEVSFSPEGHYLLSVSQGREVFLWNVSTEVPVATQERLGWRARFSRNANVLLGTTGSVWQAAGSGFTKFRGIPGTVEAISTDQSCVVTQAASSGGNTYEIAMWDIQERPTRQVFGEHDDELYCAAISPDGARVATGGADGTAVVWDAATGQRLLIIDCRTNATNRWIRSVAFSPDGELLVTGGSDGKARVWEVSTGRNLSEFSGHSRGVECVQFHPDGKRIATAGDEGSAQIWDWATGEVLTTVSGPASMSSLAFSPDGRHLITETMNGVCDLWEVESGRKVRSLSTNLDRGTSWKSLAISADGSRVAAGRVGSGGAVRGFIRGLLQWSRLAVSKGDPTNVWSVPSGRRIARLEVASTGISLPRHGERIVHAGSSNTIGISDVATGREILRLRGHTDGVRTTSFDVSGLQLVSGSTDRTAILWPAFPYRDSDYPGPKATSLEERIEEHKRRYWREWESRPKANVTPLYIVQLQKKDFTETVTLKFATLSNDPAGLSTGTDAPSGKTGVVFGDGPALKLLSELAFKPGDVILDANGVPTDRVEALFRALADFSNSGSAAQYAPLEFGIGRGKESLKIRLLAALESGYRVKTATGAIEVVDELVIPDKQPTGLCCAADGTVYYVESGDFATGTLGILDVEACQMKPLLTDLKYPHNIASFGDEIIFTERGTTEGKYKDGTLSVYSPKTSTRSILYSGLEYPQSLSVDKNGNIYVLEAAAYNTKFGGNARLIRFPYGSKDYEVILPKIGRFEAIAVGSDGRLYIGTRGKRSPGKGGALLRFDLDGTGQKTMLKDLQNVNALTFDAQGNLYLAFDGERGGNPDTIGVVKPESAQLTVLKKGMQAWSLAVDQKGRILYSIYESRGSVRMLTVKPVEK
ncbi:MAG: protein kinase [Candidatus Hydrogenedentes bacterium]|nr:protein kinase [Candidatus Hydrogenedentota bacterium]